MKFLFFPQGCLPIHAKSLEERPLGGTESGLIYLSEELAKLGHEVVVLTSFPNPPLSNPLYLPFQSIGDVGPVDVFVAIREWMPLLSNYPTKLRLFWTGDSYDQPQNLGMGDRRIASRIDAFLAVSDWHKRRICEESRFPVEKAWVIRNGIRLGYFAGTEQRVRKRLIYSSTPYRGLQLLPEIFPAIRARHPDAELHVMSGYQVYSGPSGYDKRAEQQFQALAQRLQSIPGVVLRGNIRHSELAREFMRSSVLCYPNTFEETSCITALEAQAAGCAIVTSARGALPETVGKAGILISGEPGSTQYNRDFVDAVCSVLENDALFESLSTAGTMQSSTTDWSHVASRLVSFIETRPSTATTSR